MDGNKDIFDRIMSLPALKRFWNIYCKNKSVLLYLFFGGLTTVISVASFALFEFLRCETLVSNFISWICAVSFAYITNRIWVFNSATKGKAAYKEIISFFGGRLFTFFVEELMLFVFTECMDINSIFVKIVAQIVVLISNYVISKVLVFKK